MLTYSGTGSSSVDVSGETFGTLWTTHTWGTLDTRRATYTRQTVGTLQEKEKVKGAFFFTAETIWRSVGSNA